LAELLWRRHYRCLKISGMQAGSQGAAEDSVPQQPKFAPVEAEAW